MESLFQSQVTLKLVGQEYSAQIFADTNFIIKEDPLIGVGLPLSVVDMTVTVISAIILSLLVGEEGRIRIAPTNVLKVDKGFCP